MRKFDDLGKTRYVSPAGPAAVQFALGNRDEAFALLERAYQVHDWWLHRLKVDPFYAPLLDDPRYKDLLKRLGLPE